MNKLDKAVLEITELLEQTLEGEACQSILNRHLKTYPASKDAELAGKVASVVRATVHRILSVERIQPTLQKIIRDLGLD